MHIVFYDQLREPVRLVRQGITACGMLLAAFVSSPVSAAENWVAKNVYDPFSSQSHCVAESRHHRIHDGYQDTVIYLQIGDKRLSIVTESSIDPKALDNGIRVDGNEPIKPDAVRLEHDVIFEKDLKRIVGQFRRGQKVTVNLKFWPTWPDKGYKNIEFSLIGFSKTFARLPNC